MRQVVLDTETTGLETSDGHRIIELGCVELVNRKHTRKHFHRYVNPERRVDPGALDVHGLNNDFLAAQPKFREVAQEFLEFVDGAELVIHNAEFDVTFLDYELGLLPACGRIADRCGVLDTLALARRMHPGQRNTLDALAKRYNVDNSKRELHGALLDAQILAEIYLTMTGGQVALSLDGDTDGAGGPSRGIVLLDRAGLDLAVQSASGAEQAAHEAMLARMREASGGALLWDVLASPDAAGAVGRAAAVGAAAAGTPEPATRADGL